MKSVLEELYYGNIRPFSNRRIIDSEKQETLQSMEDYRSRILADLTKNQHSLWEQYENCMSELTSQTECEIFIDGFRLGFRFACEIFKVSTK